jgi:protein-L-isoaspartate(D-aspartate) O-methyltransferase
VDTVELRKKLVMKLKQDGRISSEPVERAVMEVPRELFVPCDQQRFAYMDQPLSIGNGQTISAPHMVAIMAEALDVHEGQTILEIGSGSGYHAAIIATMVGSAGHVHSIERFPNLAESAKAHLEQAGIFNVSIHVGDGSEGYPDYAPYERIYVTASAPSTPQPLLDQLAEGGKLLIPVGGLFAELLLFEKHGFNIIKRDLGGCSFVPLVGRYGYDGS